MVDDATVQARSRMYGGRVLECALVSTALLQTFFCSQSRLPLVRRDGGFQLRRVIGFVAVLATLLLPLTAWPQRIALVVGNAAYTDRPLRNPVNDAQLMQSTLRDLGFEVQVATNVDRRSLLSALRDFEARARGAEVAVR